MAVRDSQKGEKALRQVLGAKADSRVGLMQLDLADLDSIRAFTAVFHKKYDQLHILMNNAGVMYPARREETKQGFELQIGTNHLGHFALTGLLLDLIEKTPEARVVNQSSLAHINGDIRLDDINLEKSYSKIKAYGQSKLANLLFTYELDRQFKAHNVNAKAIASHPGISKTGLFRTSGSFMKLVLSIVGQEPEMGALPILRAATDGGLTGGEYIGPTKLGGARGYPEIVKSGKKSYYIKLAKDLWTLSEKMTDVHFDF